VATKEEKCEFCGCRGGDTICYYNCGCHKPKDEKVLPKISLPDMKLDDEKCEFCGCRGGSTICYYNCGCHKPKDEKVLPKK
jgi:hypothetical protein